MTSSGVPSRTASPSNVAENPRISSDLKAEDSKDQQENQQETLPNHGIGDSDRTQVEIRSQQVPSVAFPSPEGEEVTISRRSIDSHISTSARTSLELTRTSSRALDSPRLDAIEHGPNSKPVEYYEQTIEQMRADNEAAELRRQEETHDYLERIDTLQSKLQYLTKEAAGIAKSALSEANTGTAEHKLAAKDEKIVLLIEEGQKLSQNELKHMSIIKKLRAKSTEDETKLVETRRTAEKHEKAAREAQERAKRAEAAERRAAEKSKALPKAEKELENVRADREAKAILIQDLQRQLVEATSFAREAESKANADALELQQQLTADLRDELANLRIEKELSDRQHRTELRDLQDRFDRERERARIVDIERQGEQNVSKILKSTPF